MKIKLSIRQKILFVSIMLALIPLGVAGDSIITISRDELKSSVNDSLIHTSEQMVREIDNIFVHVWRAPLLLMKSAIDNPDLGVNEKVALLESSIRDVEDFLSLQLYVSGFPKIMFVKDDFRKKLEKTGIDFQKALSLEKEASALYGREVIRITHPRFLKEHNTWMIAILAPLTYEISGRQAVLAVYVNLGRIREMLDAHPMNRMGRLYLINQQGAHVFDPNQKDLSHIQIVDQAKTTLRSGSGAMRIEPFVGPGGQRMVGGYAVIPGLNWAVVMTIDEADAYLSIQKMQVYLMFWLAVGLLAAAIVAFVFSMRITKPILEIGQVVKKVGQGNLSARVRELKTGDEIATLGSRINEMIQGLLERFHLEKFVSSETIGAIKKAGGEGIKLGGVRKTATVLFSDIRNFTAFSEKVGPETVIEMLNMYLSVQANIVHKYQGDIDKYVGDELIAVFQGEHMVDHALQCSCEIHEEIEKLNAIRPEWDIRAGIGINTGDMVMGAMGSEDRMDYTILGDNVNLGARLCSQAGPSKTIISAAAFAHLKNAEQFEIIKLEPVRVKGKSQPIEIYEVSRRSCVPETDGIEKSSEMEAHLT